MITRHSVEKAAFPVMKLGEAVDFLDSRRRPVTESERKAGPYPYYGANGTQGTIDTFIFDESLILLAEDGGHFDEPDRGVAYRISGKTWVNNHAHVLRPKAYLDMAYLCRVLENYDLSPFVSGTTRGKLTKAGACEIPIPVPPLPEQRRIADILDRADALRAKRRAALARLDELTQAIFIEMFGNHRQTPVTIGDRLEKSDTGWSWELLTDMGRLATGHTPDRKRSEYWGGHIPWITLTDIRKLDGSIATQTSEGVTEEGIENSSAVKLPPGTVCFSRTASVGFVTVMGKEMATSQDFVNWVCGPKLDPIFLMHAFLLSRERLRSLSTGSTHKTIYFPTVERFRVLVPPLDRQRSFSRSIENISAIKSIYHRMASETDAFFASLQDRAFRGAL